MIKSNSEPIEDGDFELEGKVEQGAAGSSVEQAKPFVIETEINREVSSAEKDDAYGKILSKVQSTQADDGSNQSTIADDAKNGAGKMDAQSQVQHLIDIAGQKGVVHAVKVAQHMQDNYVLDTFHDQMLAEELHNALVEKGMIKEI